MGITSASPVGMRRCGELSPLMTLFLKAPAKRLKHQIPITSQKKWEQAEDEWGGRLWEGHLPYLPKAERGLLDGDFSPLGPGIIVTNAEHQSRARHGQSRDKKDLLSKLTFESGRQLPTTPSLQWCRSSNRAQWWCCEYRKEGCLFLPAAMGRLQKGRGTGADSQRMGRQRRWEWHSRGRNSV